jgi:uncharacterized protein YbaP (TraB family)
MKSCLGRYRRAALLLAAASLSAAAQTAPRAASCPPQAAPPTQQQLQSAAANARDRGMLWRITRDGRSSYLYASIHVGKLDWSFPGPQVRAALMATDTLALELDPGDPQIVARMRPPAAATAPALSPALKERLARQADAACLPRELLAAQHPVMQALTLTVLAARWQGLEPGYAQELVLGGFARAAQHPVVSLESPESQMAALIPLAAADARHMVKQLLEQLEQGVAQRGIARLAAAWERGDLADLGDYERWCECITGDDDRRQMNRLLDERNPGLAAGIEALHREGRTVFGAIGALHMTGSKALPLLLQQHGFGVERVALQ